MGWKMVYLARRNPALAAAEFPQAWREHSALGARCTNVRDKVLSVTQCSRVLEPPPLRGAADDYDGVNLLALRDLQAAADIWSDPETLTIMRPDEPRVFATYVRDFTLVCEERPLRDNPRTTTALIGFLRRSTGRTGADWQRWMPPAGSCTTRSAGRRRRVTSTTASSSGGSIPPRPREQRSGAATSVTRSSRRRRAVRTCSARCSCSRRSPTVVPEPARYSVWTMKSDCDVRKTGDR